MKKTAVVLCPGRGTYQKTELGSLAAYYQNPLLGQIDGVRQALGLATVSELDQAERYLHALHQLPSNNAALIYAAGLLQFQGIDRDEYDIVAVSGNSMGWYTTLSCAGVLGCRDWHRNCLRHGQFDGNSRRPAVYLPITR